MNITFTNDLWTVLLIMLTGGVLGGAVNFYFVPLSPDQPRSLGRSLVLGMGASALVPVFLFVTQSKVLDKLFEPVSATLSVTDKSINILFFISLCLLAGISSTRFITSVSDQLITQLKKDINDTKADVKENQEKLNQTQQAVKATDAKLTDTAQKALENKATIRALKEVQKEHSLKVTAAQPTTARMFTQRNSVVNDDPQKNQWGGQSINNEYELTASVTAVDSDNDLFRVLLRVQYTGSAPVQANDSVMFHLPDTFVPSVRTVPFQDRKATLELLAWGAFTVGAVTANQMPLELDLSDPELVPNAPQAFRER